MEPAEVFRSFILEEVVDLQFRHQKACIHGGGATLGGIVVHPVKQA
jgi:hypothetical protein